MAARYFSIDNGTALLRRNDTPTKLSFDLLDNKGIWIDGTDIGVRYTIEHSETGADEIKTAAAVKLAAKLGGEL